MMPQEVLTKLGIPFQEFHHPAVFTCEEAEKLCQAMPGLKNKNLFLRDGKGKQYFLVTLGQDKFIRLQELEKLIGAKGLSFASEERLKKVLKIKKGCVGILALLNDTEKQTKVFVDQDLLQGDFIQSHPFENTATICFPSKDLEKIFHYTGHTLVPIRVPI